ncbi:MAG: hypothetical protein ABWZ15_11630 [Acidimicrobiia bacterium]
MNASALLLTGGARGADIIAAEQARRRGAEVWLLLPEPEESFVESSVRIAGTDWETRFASLRDSCRVLIQDRELGPRNASDDLYERNNRWLLDVATAQAHPGRPRALIVWDGKTSDGPGGTDDLVSRARPLVRELVVVEPHTECTDEP